MNIYLSPEAIAAANAAGVAAMGGRVCLKKEPHKSAREAAYRALIQYIVENPRELSEEERERIQCDWEYGNSAMGRNRVQDFFERSLRLAFTPPTPDVPEKIVAICDKHLRPLGNGSMVTFDAARAAVTEAYEAGMAVSK